MDYFRKILNYFVKNTPENDFIISDKTDLNNCNEGYFELKSKNLNEYIKCVAIHESSVQICVVHNRSMMHCGVIAKNNFKIDNKFYVYGMLHLAYNRQAKCVEIRVHFRNNIDECSNILANVLGISSTNTNTLISEPQPNSTKFQNFMPWIERTLNKKFVLSLKQIRDFDDFLNGTNCLKCVESFSRVIGYKISKDFEKKLNDLINEKHQAQIQDNVDINAVELSFDFWVSSKTRVPDDDEEILGQYREYLSSLRKPC